MFHLIDRIAGWWRGYRATQAAAACNAERAPGVQLKRVSGDATGVKLVYEAPLVLELADQAAAILKSIGADTYLQFDMMPRADRACNPIRITVQWAHGVSPAVKAAQLEQENARLRAALYNKDHGLSIDEGTAVNHADHS